MKHSDAHQHPLGASNVRGAGVPQAREGRVWPVERWMVQRLLSLLDWPSLEVRLWNGETIGGDGQGEPPARVTIADRGALYGLLRNPHLNFGDAYAAGRIDVEGDLVRFLEAAFQRLEAAHGRGWLWRITHRLQRPRRNTLTGSQRNIQHHYDLGNDFYALWLDDDMVYTCAYFPDPGVTLEQAQAAKMEHVCRKLRLQPGETVVEAGCGWGSLARYMARHYGVKVRAFNISKEQVRYARERAKAEGLDGQVEYVLDDYRNIEGRYDAFVSVGMLEHVGTAHYRALGEVIERCLSPNGRGLVHTIGRNRPAPMNAWIEKRIFPGAYPPVLREMMDIFEPWALSIQDVENLRLHYAKTLEHWLQRFETAAPKVREMYDEFFTRAWRLYLAGSIAAFTTGSLQLFQVMFTRPNDNALPWTRGHLYEAAGGE